MKKILIYLSVLFLMSGCDNKTKDLSCTSTSETGGVRTTTTYNVKYMNDEVKHVTIIYDYNQQTNNNTTDGVNANTDGTTENNDNNNNLTSDDVVDGVVGDAIDTTIDGVKDTILDLAGIKSTIQNQMSTYDNIEGLTYKVDVDTNNEYKIIYEIDMDKIKEEDLTRFDVRKDFSETKSNYDNLGYTCE